MPIKRRFTGLLRFRHAITGPGRRRGKVAYARGEGCQLFDGRPAVGTIANVRLCKIHLARVQQIKAGTGTYSHPRAQIGHAYPVI